MKSRQSFKTWSWWMMVLIVGTVSPTFASEADLAIPDLGAVRFVGVTGVQLLEIGILICFAGMLFGARMYRNLRNLPVHRSMLEISELIYETCKTYLKTQIRFILL